MRSEDIKGDVEVEVFKRFLPMSGLPIDPRSVEKQTPPSPDILCVHQTDGPISFELTELCDPNIAQMLNADDPTPKFVWTSDPSPRIFRKKLRKTYPVAHPLELLCYTAGRIVTPDDVLLPTIRPIFESRRSPFRRAWLLGETGVHVIASSV
jgi:hypothetical protein